MYFYCERTESGVRWRLYTPMNDPLRNGVNQWQAIAHGSNVDFQPLIDHFSALDYITKYAAKAEKGSKSFDEVLSSVLSRTNLEDSDSATRVYAAVLSQQIGGRNWSAQEVGHVNMGCATVISSHVCHQVSLSGKRRATKG